MTNGWERDRVRRALLGPPSARFAGGGQTGLGLTLTSTTTLNNTVDCPEFSLSNAPRFQPQFFKNKQNEEKA